MTVTGDRETGQAKGRRAAVRAAIALVAFVLVAVFVFVLSPGARYDWAKAIHVVAVISWMAGMLYLPRLFVYHSDAEPDSDKAETFVVMERRLLKIIMLPAMSISWALGLWLAWASGAFTQGWFLAKLVAVIVMTGAHGHMSKAAKAFAAGERPGSARYWRVFNEVPTVAMIVAVILVIVRPF